MLNSFYTFSKALDDCDNDYGVCTGVAPVENRNLNKARAGYDRTHVFVTNATYELPIGKGRKWVNKNKFLDYLVGGYELAWIQTIESGNPFGVSSPTVLTITTRPRSAIRFRTWRANISMPQFGHRGSDRRQSVQSGAGEPGAAMSAASRFRLHSRPGNAGRNIITGPGVIYSQVSAKKNFRDHGTGQPAVSL